VPTDLDVYAPERWRDDALFAPEVKDAYPLDERPLLRRREEVRS